MKSTDGTQKIFPINNQSACVWKWGWNTFRLYTGGSSSCHRIKNVFVPLDDFDNFHNTPEVVNDRRLMQEGKWPSGRGCEYCKDIESSGGISDRLFHNPIAGLSPIDLDAQGQNLYVTPRILELYLNNTCDLACVYCIPIFSSKINEELKKFGSLPTIDIKPIDRIPDHQKYLEKMINWLGKNSKNLQRLSIQGGEPFLQKEFNVLIDWLERNDNPDLELSFNTNLNEKPGVIDGYVVRLRKMLVERKIKRVDFNCSIDCWGPQQEFIRYGLDLRNWQRNFEFLLEHPWLHVHAGHTVTSLSIKTLPLLLDLVNTYRSKGHRVYQTFGHVDGQNQTLYDPIFFGGDFFYQDLKICESLIPAGMEKDRFIGIAKRIQQSTLDLDRLTALHVTLDSIDKRRKTNWKSLFPDIHQFFLENGVANVV